MKWKWRNDRRSERNLCNCVKKPEKNWINMIVIDVIDFMFFLLTDSFFILIRNYNEIDNNSVSLISESN